MCRLLLLGGTPQTPLTALTNRTTSAMEQPMIFAPHEARPDRGREFTLRLERLMPEFFIRMRLSKSRGQPLCRGSLAHATSPPIDTTEL